MERIKREAARVVSRIAFPRKLLQSNGSIRPCSGSRMLTEEVLYDHCGSMKSKLVVMNYLKST
jgi:hypothetical protein